ncbi:TRAP transporter small permease [Pseudohoeflea coraliihabitans]|uniref:TRAP transporter small permease protein n=1 Tax=Pseudohoeflea coraliihabitans TaxID=2860393 RepID=A0ABS6WJZ1_9HYPH|nr:TRAP transporter small permease subunit [Pseudohoeflea sp. DP4N28-3]MBW3096264.1 TRAP transporter small permease subunit [Pseudohoeflea sp. DP4N28-3]
MSEVTPGGVLHKFWVFKLWLQKFVLVATCAGFTVLVMMEIVFRYFLFLPLHGIEELATYLAVWTYFIGGAYGAYERSHISASLLDVFVKNKRVFGVLDLVVKAITLVVSVWMSVWVLQYLLWSIERRPHSLELQMPLYFVHASMVVGLSLMAFYFFLDFAVAVSRLAGSTRLAELREANIK